jgi:hypothetical protein
MYSMNTFPSEADEAIREGISKYLTTPEELLNIAQTLGSLISESREVEKTLATTA